MEHTYVSDLTENVTIKATSLSNSERNAQMQQEKLSITQEQTYGMINEQHVGNVGPGIGIDVQCQIGLDPEGTQLCKKANQRR